MSTIYFRVQKYDKVMFFPIYSKIYVLSWLVSFQTVVIQPYSHEIHAQSSQNTDIWPDFGFRVKKFFLLEMFWNAKKNRVFWFWSKIDDFFIIESLKKLCHISSLYYNYSTVIMVKMQIFILLNHL